MHESFFYNALASAVDGDRRTLIGIKKKCGSWERAYALHRTIRRPDDAFTVPDAEKAWAELERFDVRLVMAGEPDYPTLLKEIIDPPFGLYILGRLPKEPYFAAVGTRRATPEGTATMRRFTATLARAGFAIVSGLALGMDAAAHEGCLEGGGTTIAVLAGGLHDVYPGENKKLAEKILAQGGALVSEYPIGSPPYPSRFIERNRIIAGLSRGALIMETPEKSGALATARLAMEENRDVFVVPGAIANKNYEGSHALIRQGAELVTSPEQILESYGIMPRENIDRVIIDASSEEKQVLKALRDTRAPLDVDKILAATKLEPQTVNRTLAFLLSKDLIKERNGRYTI